MSFLVEVPKATVCRCPGHIFQSVFLFVCFFLANQVKHSTKQCLEEFLLKGEYCDLMAVMQSFEGRAYSFKPKVFSQIQREIAEKLGYMKMLPK